jgi:hypothetical protein
MKSLPPDAQAALERAKSALVLSPERVARVRSGIDQSISTHAPEAVSTARLPRLRRAHWSISKWLATASLALLLGAVSVYLFSVLAPNVGRPHTTPAPLTSPEPLARAHSSQPAADPPDHGAAFPNEGQAVRAAPPLSTPTMRDPMLQRTKPRRGSPALRTARSTPPPLQNEFRGAPPASSEAVVSAASRAPTEAPPPTGHESPPRAGSSQTDVPPALDALASELSILRRARRALERGDAVAALAELDLHAQRHARGALREEALATRVLVLCELGRAQPARAALTLLKREAPRSPHLPRLFASCAGP